MCTPFPVLRVCEYADLSKSPQGVGAGRKPPLWLKDGDIVEVALEGVGACINKVEHIKSRPKL